jgi:hypothetical protein
MGVTRWATNRYEKATTDSNSALKNSNQSAAEGKVRR